MGGADRRKARRIQGGRVQVPWALAKARAQGGMPLMRPLLAPTDPAGYGGAMDDHTPVEAALPNPNADLLAAVRLLGRTSVLVVGDVMLDRYVYGQVERISPEAPVPVLRMQREAVTLGGAGNVVRNIVSLGGQVDLVGIVGQDQA